MPPIVCCSPWLVGLVLFAQSGADDPAAVLNKAGLKRVENSFVLAGELEARKLEDEAKNLQKKLAQAQQQKQAAQARLGKDQRQAAELRAEADRLRRQAKQKPGTNNKKGGNSPNERAKDLDAKARKLLQDDGQDRADKQQQAEADRTIDAAQKQLPSLRSRHQALVKQTQKQYDDLARRPEIVRALRTINKGARPKVALGPIPAYATNLANHCADHLLDLGLKHDAGLFYPEDEDALVKDAAAARLALQQAGKDGALDGPARSELAATAATLRKRIVAIEARRAALATDPQVADLLAEIDRQTGKTKVTLGSLPAFKRAVKEVEAVEAATRSGGPKP